MSEGLQAVNERLDRAERLWLFLDYDGTLADFAPTPDHVVPDPELIALLTRLGRHPSIRVAVISGRRLAHIQKLIPVTGLLLAGTYGIELRLPEGERIDRLDYDSVRPVLETLKPRWQALIDGREGFYLEDKGWSLALHARFADDDETQEVLPAARDMATRATESGSPELFRLLGGHKFLEIGPHLAHKGRTLDYLLDRYPWSGAQRLFVGDDDKDEEAFEAIKARGGMAVVVAAQPRPTVADARLASPRKVRQWLATLPDRYF